MSTTAIILIVVAVIVVLAAVAFVARRQRARQLDQKRGEAREHREQADTSGRKAEQARLAAEEQADRARKEQTAAEEHRQQAQVDVLGPDHGSRRFDRFGGSYEVGPEGTKIELTIDADSLDTGNATRDKHLRSTDFFGVAEHPQVRFTSTRVRDARDGVLRVEGDLDAAGKAIRLEFDATVEQVDDMLEVEATTTLDQRQLGMSSGLLGMIHRPATLHVKARLGGTGR
jgi:polyisoprenoid-binding protein YceI